MPILVPFGFLTPKKDEQTDAHMMPKLGSASWNNILYMKTLFMNNFSILSIRRNNMKTDKSNFR